MYQKPVPRTKFVVEYHDDEGRISSRWHYDKDKFPFGPILVEEFDYPVRKEKKPSKKLTKKK